MMRTHRKKKPYQCTQCDYTCKEHNHSKAPQQLYLKPYKCAYSLCSYTCRTVKQLIFHSNIMHKGGK